MIIFTLVALAVVILDQISKLLVLEYIKPIDTLPLLKNIFHFTYVENEGAAFGMLADQRWIFMVASTIVIIILIAYIIVTKPKSKLALISFGLICGGGIGNMIDRIFRTFVVDFIDVRCIKFYVFNIADSCVCIGCGLLIIFFIIDEIKAQKAKKEASNSESSNE